VVAPYTCNTASLVLCGDGAIPADSRLAVRQSLPAEHDAITSSVMKSRIIFFNVVSRMFQQFLSLVWSVYVRNSSVQSIYSQHQKIKAANRTYLYKIWCPHNSLQFF
jgi:hypothetical protein